MIQNMKLKKYQRKRNELKKQQAMPNNLKLEDAHWETLAVNSEEYYDAGNYRGLIT